MKYERHEQIIGRYIVSMRGKEADVFVVDQVHQTARNFTASEALVFLAWLQEHKDELYQAGQPEQSNDT